jgi:exopolysaccharide biosynthesis polyprenyl glycosylphosphotransferase
MNKTKTVRSYLLFDVLAACISWTAFYFYHTGIIESQRSGPGNGVTPYYYLPLFVLPLFWVTIFYITGYYNNIYRKSRLIELNQTFFHCLFGITILFFYLLLNDRIHGHENYFKLFLILFSLQFGATYLFRVIHTSNITAKIHRRQFGFNTLLIGGNDRATELFRNLTTQPTPSGNQLVGFIKTDTKPETPLSEHLLCLGDMEDIPAVIEKYKIEEVIIAISSTENQLLSKLLILLQRFKLTIWGIPDLRDLLSGIPKNDNLYGLPLFKISNGVMPSWALNVKRIFDVSFSILALLISAPVVFFIVLAIRFDSPGPIIYCQSRIGRYGRPFKIYKFRSMVASAEQEGPQLSSPKDPRITKVGQFLRKTHLDEIPQFINVIRGNMSIVGPRPERKFYVDQLSPIAPQYTLLHKVRPGLTSWGQIKYGYASDIRQMLERLPYDLVYLKNASLYLDFKIMIYSVLELFHARGK